MPNHVPIGQITASPRCDRVAKKNSCTIGGRMSHGIVKKITNLPKKEKDNGDIYIIDYAIGANPPCSIMKRKKSVAPLEKTPTE